MNLMQSAGGPLGSRALGDVGATRQSIYANALKAAQEFQPVSNARYVLELGDVDYDGPEMFTKADEKRAILEGRSLGRRLRGTWRLRANDPTGQVIDQKRTTLASIPHMTPRGTFILGGNEYSLSHQMRLRPGIFTRVKESGELESHVNVARGFGHRYFLDPETGVFRIQFGQSRMPLMPVLKALGAKDSDIRNAWGNELYVANAAKSDPRTLKKLYKKFTRRDATSDNVEDLHTAIKKAFEEMVLDPEVTQRTLGKGYTNVNPEVILASTAKLLRIYRGEDQSDDRDAMAFQRLLGPEDLFAERIRKSSGEARRALWKATLPGNLQRLYPGLMEKSVRGTLLDTGLGASPEEINPAELYDQRVRVTRMGEGGIPSMDSVPDESRMVQPSHLGFIDPVHTPECVLGDAEVMTKQGWVRFDEVTDQHEFACLIDNALEFHKPEKIIKQQYTGTMYGMRTQTTAYCVTPNHRNWVRPYQGGDPKWRFEEAAASHMKPRKLLNGGHGAYAGRDVEYFELPAIPVGGNHQKEFAPIPIELWCEFMGWYLSEGCLSKDHVKITQSRKVNPQNCKRIEAMLTALGWQWSCYRTAYTVCGKQLITYLSQFGLSEDKYLPDELLEAPEAARRILLDALIAGDGRKGNTLQYCSVSEQLAKDVQRLCFGLGISTQIVFEPDAREQANFGGTWVVYLHKYNERIVREKMRAAGSGYYTRQHVGYVYCATVPGGLMYVRCDGKGGHWTGNSGRIGVDTRLATRTLKGDDGRIYSRFINQHTGKIEWKSPQDLADAVVAFPGELESGEDFVRAQHAGKLKYVPKNKVDYQLVHMTEAFGPLSSLVPLKPAAFGQRVSMGARMITQALPVTDPEAPLVQSGIPGTEESYESVLGEDMGAVKSPVDGTILEIANGRIKIRGRDRKVHYADLHENYPYNRKTFVNNTPIVRPGDRVSAGQLLAPSNFTDREGVTALGKNARVAYLPYKGYNYEDAIVIADSFAKRMSSEHMYQNSLDTGDGTRASKNAFVSIFPGEHDRRLLDKFDTDGVIKVGEEVQADEPLILAVRERKTGPRLGRRKSAFADASIKWEHHEPGIVTDVYKGKKNISVIVKSIHPTQVGDKFSGRYGDKGVVAKIVPDDEMPVGADGKPFEVLLNPAGVISRGNPAQIIEASLGKVAALTGKPYRLPDFDKISDLREFAERELRKHNLASREPLKDPKTGQVLKDVIAGNRFIMKLHHTAEAKSQARATGGYTSEGAPAKGGNAGSKKVGMLELNSLLSHGAYKTIHDASVVRGQRNEDYWRQLMSGHSPIAPDVPFVYQKFVAQLQGAGINPVRKGAKIQIMAMTNDDARTMTGDRKIRSADTVDWRVSNLAPIKGGLFDEGMTGGHGGNRWSYIQLHEPMPNPVMEEPLRRILGLTKQQFEDLLSGKSAIPGKEHLVGPEGLKQILEDLNLDREIAKAQAEIKSGKKTYRDRGVKRLEFLKFAKQLGQHPKNWMMDRVPVLPPIFRPVSLMANTGTPLIDDPNYLYKEVFDANDNLASLSKLTDDISDERLAVYKAFKAVTGLGDPIQPENREHAIKGLLASIFGASPKFGTVQRKLLGSTVDLVGRAAITPNPELDMDQVGLPIDKAWTLYQPFVVRRLVRRGMSKLRAMEDVKDRTPTALAELQSEMRVRPIIINRAPVLHRYGVMAFWPRLTTSDTLEIPPLVTSGFNADFDGDAMQFHLPSTDDAVKEAKEKLLPSRNLFSVQDFSAHYLPSHEYVGGLWAATAKEDSKKPVRVFNSKKDAIAAYRRGDLAVDARIEIRGS